jgi:hypothetical protein
MSDDTIRADGREPLLLTPRQQRALLDVLEQQIAIDESRMFAAGPTTEERDEAMHGVRHPIQDGDAVLYPIACRRNVLAQRRGEELGWCRWVADDSGIAGSVSCTACGKTEAPGMARQPELRAMVDGTWSPRSRRATAENVGQLVQLGYGPPKHDTAAIKKGMFPTHNGPGGSS